MIICLLAFLLNGLLRAMAKLVNVLEFQCKRTVVSVSQPPNDSFSSLCFSPMANILVATSWDNQVRCWEISHSGTAVATAHASISHDHLDDGTTVFSGGCDKQVKMWPLLSGGQPVTVAMHDVPIEEVAWIPEMNLLATGSWDKTLNSSVRSLRCAVEYNDLAKWANMCIGIVKWYWDTRQPNPVHTQQLPDRCYALTVRYQLMVVGTADRNLIVFNLQNPQLKHVFCVAAAAATLVVG
ncbi:protein RAE1 [Citrus sinensis]|nr:protein RAE1 [Citrus sinensis]